MITVKNLTFKYSYKNKDLHLLNNKTTNWNHYEKTIVICFFANRISI
jgi:hypothetical protein